MLLYPQEPWCSPSPPRPPPARTSPRVPLLFPWRMYFTPWWKSDMCFPRATQHLSSKRFLWKRCPVKEKGNAEKKWWVGLQYKSSGGRRKNSADISKIWDSKLKLQKGNLGFQTKPGVLPCGPYTEAWTLRGMLASKIAGDNRNPAMSLQVVFPVCSKICLNVIFKRIVLSLSVLTNTCDFSGTW